MKIKTLLVISSFLCAGTSFGADDLDAAAQATVTVTEKAKPAAGPKAKPKSKAKSKPKTTKKTSPKAKKKKARKAPAPTGAPQAFDADPAAIAAATQAYKKEVAEKIVNASSANVYGEQPQALLRSVVVVKFLVDADGQLLKSEVRRSNHDHVTEATALATLRKAAPLPKPPAILVRHGSVELHETWLFNKDGRFQIRSTAKAQIDR